MRELKEQKNLPFFDEFLKKISTFVLFILLFPPSMHADLINQATPLLPKEEQTHSLEHLYRHASRRLYKGWKVYTIYCISFALWLVVLWGIIALTGAWSYYFSYITSYASWSIRAWLGVFILHLFFILFGYFIYLCLRFLWKEYKMLAQPDISIQSLKKQIIPLDKIAVDHATMSLHFYEQWLSGHSLDFKSSIKRDVGLFGRLAGIGSTVRFLHKAIPSYLLEGWTFYPVYGKTGPKDLLQGRMQKRSLLGVLGIHHEGKLISLAFRHSLHHSDWCNNLNFSIKKASFLSFKGYVHAGFANVLSASLPDIHAALDAALAPLKKEDLASWDFLVSGHSLGGAIAQLLAPYLVDQARFPFCHKENVHLITFGAPYVGMRYGPHDFDTWLIQHVHTLRIFCRICDQAPKVSYMSKWKRKSNQWLTRYHPGIRVADRLPHIFMPHLGVSSLQFLDAHHLHFYREAIYLALGFRYEPLYTCS